MVEAESLEAGQAFAALDQRVVVQGLGGGHEQRQVVDPAHAGQLTRLPPAGNADRVQAHHPGHIEAPQRDGRGADADLEVVVAVDHGVFGVVGNDPGELAGQQPPHHRRDLVEDGRESHRDAEGIGHAQHGLRHREEALGKGVDDGDRQRPEGQRHGVGVGGEHQRERDQRQHHPDEHDLLDGDAATGERALRRALDMAVNVLVGEVVDGAARAAHQDGAQGEDREQVPARETACRHPQGHQGGPQQQQPALGAVPADQVEVERPAVAQGQGGGGVHTGIMAWWARLGLRRAAPPSHPPAPCTHRCGPVDAPVAPRSRPAGC